MTEDQEVRARALEIAIQYRGDSHLKFDTLFRFARMFGKYIATGVYEYSPTTTKPPDAKADGADPRPDA